MRRHNYHLDRVELGFRVLEGLRAENQTSTHTRRRRIEVRAERATIMPLVIRKGTR